MAQACSLSHVAPTQRRPEPHRRHEQRCIALTFPRRRVPDPVTTRSGPTFGREIEGGGGLHGILPTKTETRGCVLPRTEVFSAVRALKPKAKQQKKRRGVTKKKKNSSKHATPSSATAQRQINAAPRACALENRPLCWSPSMPQRCL